MAACCSLTDEDLLTTFQDIGNHGRPNRLEMKFDTWPALLTALLGGGPSTIYRGQQQLSWDLTSSLERVLRGTNPRSWSVAERGIHRRFAEQAAPLLDRPPAQDDEIGWLMLMQHFSAPTRLLDWSKSPFVALWFAYEHQNDGKKDRALWTLDAGHLRGEFLALPRDPWGVIPGYAIDSPGIPRVEEVSFPSQEHDWRAHENRLIRVFRQAATLRRETRDTDDAQSAAHPIPLVITDLVPRLAAQQAVFTYDVTINGGIPYQDIPSVERITLPDDWRIEVLTHLRSMGITASTLFPGLDGVGRASAMAVSLPPELEDSNGFLGPRPNRSET